MDAIILPRVFIHTVNGHEVRLKDLGSEYTPEAILDFYSGTYPILATAKIGSPEIIDDELKYKFISTIGTKG